MHRSPSSDLPHLIVPAFVLALSVVACSTMPPADAGMAASAGCRAEAAHDAIGREASAEVIERVRTATGSRIVRVIRPGDAVAEDLRPDRLNLDVNDRGAIVGASCG